MNKEAKQPSSYLARGGKWQTKRQGLEPGFVCNVWENSIVFRVSMYTIASALNLAKEAQEGESGSATSLPSTEQRCHAAVLSEGKLIAAGSVEDQV